MRHCLVLGVVLALVVGCDSGGPAAPPPTAPQLTCTATNTATVFFRNRSNTNSTYQVLWDGVRLETLPPSERSPRHVVTAGIQHELVFKFRTTGRDACGVTTHTLAQCSDQGFSCSG